MAKKVERLKVEDDTGFDADLDFGSLDFDGEIDGLMDDDLTSDNRTPVVKALSATLEAAGDGVLDVGNYKDIIKRAMPDEYGKITRDLSPLTSKLRDTYREQADAMKPGLKDLARNVDKLIPQENARAKDLLNRVREKLGIEDDYYRQENSRETDMKNNLEDIFNEQKEVENERYIRDKAEDKIEKGIEEKRFKTEVNISSTMQSDIARLRQYNDRINIAYQKKSLELQYKSLFVATDLLAETKRSNALARPQLMAIAKNTALPEIQKQRLTENVKETLRNRFKGTVDRALFDKDGYFQRGVDNLVGRLNDKLSGVSDSVDAANSMANEFSGMMEMSGSMPGMMSKEQVLATGVVNFLSGYVTEAVGDKIKDKVFTKDKADSGVYRKLIQMSKYTDNLPGLIHDLRSSDKLEEKTLEDPDNAGMMDILKNKLGNLGKTAISSLLESFDEDYIGGTLSSGQGIHAIEVADGFDTRTKKTINDVIPGLLSMQLKELQIIRTGREDIELVRYDHKEGKFSSTSELAERFRSDLIKKSSEGGLDRKVKEIVDEIIGGKTISEKARIILTRRVKSLSNEKGVFDTKFLKSDAFYKGMDGDVVDELKLIINENFDESKKGFTYKDKEISSQFVDLRETLKDPRLYIDDFARLGNIDILEKLGLVTKGTYDRGTINSKAIENLITGKGIKEYHDNNGGMVGPFTPGVDAQGRAKTKPKMLHEVELIRKALSDYPKQTVERLEDVIRELTTTVVSDINAKENIEQSDNKGILSKFKEFKIFDWQYKKGKGDSREHTGPMAQDIHSTFGDTAAPGGKTIDLTTLNGINMAAINELYEKYLTLEERSEIDNMKDTRSILLGIKKDTAVIAKRSGVGFGIGDINVDLHKLVVALQHLLPHIDIDSIKDGISNIGKDGKKRYRTGKEFVSDYLSEKKDEATNLAKKGGIRLWDSINWGADKLRRGGRVGKINAKKIYRKGKKYWDEHGDDIKETVKDRLFKLKDTAFEMMSSAADRLKTVYSEILPKGFDFLKRKLGTVKDFVIDTYNSPIDVYVKGQGLSADGTLRPALRAIVMKAGGYINAIDGSVITNLGQIKGEVKDLDGNIVLSFDDIDKGLVDAQGNPVKLGVTGMKDFAKAALGTVTRRLMKASGDILGMASRAGEGIKNKLSGMFPSMATFFGGFDMSQFGVFNDKTNMFLEQIRDLLNYRLPGTPTDFGLGDESSNSFIGPKRPKDLIEKTLKEKASSVKDKTTGFLSGVKDKLFSNFGNGSFVGLGSGDFVGPKQPTMIDKALAKLNNQSPKEEADTEFVGPLPQRRSLGDRFKTLKDNLEQRKKEQLGFDNGTRYKGGNIITRGLGMIGGLLGGGGKQEEETPTNTQPEDPNDKKPDTLFSKIKGLLSRDKEETPSRITNPKFNDKDGDGDRDGNFSDRQKELERRKEERKKEQLGFDDKMRYKGANVIDKMLGMIGGLLGGGGIMGALGGAGSAIGAAGDVAGTAGDIFGRNRPTTGGINPGNAAKKPGLIARGLTGAKNLVSPLLTGASLLSGTTAAASAASGLGATATAAGGLMASIGAALASPVVLTGLGIAAAGYGVYKLGSFMTRNNADDIDKIRLTQYGLSDEQDSDYHYMFELEEYLIDNVVGYGSDKQARLTGNKIDAEEVFSIFGIDPEDTGRAESFLMWFNGRFKPVFLTHLTVIARIDPKIKLDEIDDMSDEQKMTYIKGVSMPGGPYQVTASPLEDEPLLATKADVEKAIELVKEDLDVEDKETSTKTESVDKPNVQAVGTSTQLVQDKEEDKSMISKIGNILKKVALGGMFGSTLELALETGGNLKAMVSSVTGKVAKFFGMKTDYLEMARMHAYGLTKLNNAHVNPIRALEEFILDNDYVRFNPDGSATFKGDMGIILSEPGMMFGISNSSDAKAGDFTAWFNARFLPVFLFLVGTGRKLVNQSYPEHIENALTEAQKFDLVNQITGLDIWGKTNSPFKDLVLGTDNKINNSILEELKKLKKDEELKPPAAKSGSDTQSKDPNLGNKDTPPTVAPTTKAPVVPVTDTTKAVPDGVEGEKKPNTTTVSMSSGEKPASQGPIPHAAGGLALPEEGWAAIGAGSQKLKGIHPELLKNFLGMAAEYHKLTGKKISVNDGFRTYEEQVALAKRNKFAAKPGNSLHEKGLALDVDEAILNEAEKLGLMRKYGFTRPVGAEPWHMEASVMQLDDQRARRDPTLAGQLIRASVGRGGGGYGTIKGSTPKRKNYKIAKSVVEEAVGKMVSVEELVSANKDNNVPTQPIIQPDTGKPNNPISQAISTGGSSSASGSVTGASGASGSGASGGFASTGYNNPGPQSADGGKMPSASTGQSSINTNSQSLGGESGNTSAPVQATGSNAGIVDIIKQAAKKVGLDENILVAMAAIESGFRPNAKSKYSSASGLFQFLTKTWQGITSQKGGKYGISPGTSRFDPMASSLMAGEYIKQNFNYLKKFKKDLGPVEAYIAHFLGPGGAATFFKSDPNAPAAQVLPKAAAANKPIFFDKGRPRTIREIYQHFADKMKNKAKEHGVNVNISGSAPTHSDGTALVPGTRGHAEYMKSQEGGLAQSGPSAPGVEQSGQSQRVSMKRDASGGIVNTPMGDVGSSSTGGGFSSAPDLVGSAPAMGGAAAPSTPGTPLIDPSIMSNMSNVLSESLSVQKEIRDLIKNFIDKGITPQPDKRSDAAILKDNYSGKIERAKPATTSAISLKRHTV